MTDEVAAILRRKFAALFTLKLFILDIYLIINSDFFTKTIGRCQQHFAPLRSALSDFYQSETSDIFQYLISDGTNCLFDTYRLVVLFYAAVVAVLEAVCLSAVSDQTDGHIARSGVG
ncbi:MAG: hypothetical protein KKA56_08265, partial [Gammaproteobacteria bacterium]|nr:hypothetical protein [Gammaproteobacteria bacterium]